MDHGREANEFRRMRIAERIDRANDMIERYREGIDFYRGTVDAFHQLIGRIGERLGEPEPEEPR